MPELPEVETTRRGIEPHLRGQTVTATTVRERRLRWPIPADLEQRLTGQTLGSLTRRGKYLVLNAGQGTLLIHLGMSGSLRVLSPDTPWKKHDHVALDLSNGVSVRFHDPRRFGVLLWLDSDPSDHPLLAKLGPEPLGNHFSGSHLYEQSRGRRVAVKPFIMNGQVVVGVGNIYANEALFRAGIDPRQPAGDIELARYERVATAIREVLGAAIAQGGTTLRDFVNGVGEPGYFRQQLAVYERDGEPCPLCGTAIIRLKLGQRASYYCPQCQPMQPFAPC